MPKSPAPAPAPRTHAAEARLEADEIVAQLQHLRRGEADIEHDLAVLHVLARHGDAVGGGVHHDVRRLAAVGDPLVQSAQQIGAPRLQCRISRSASVKQERKVERAKIAFMYLVMGCACTGSSMP
jgi:hypothetical protein